MRLHFRNFYPLIISLFSAFWLGGQSLDLAHSYRYQSGAYATGGLVASDYDALSKRLFVANAAENKVDILALRQLSKIGRIGRIDLDPYGARPIDLLFDRSYLIVLMENQFPQGQGRLVFFDSLGAYVNQVFVGSAPRDLHLTSNGNYLLVANQGRPSEDYTQDPDGSLSLLPYNAGDPINLQQSDLQNINFRAYDSLALAPGVRIFGPTPTNFAQNAEPVAITSNASGTLAYLSLAANNAIAVIDLPGAQIDTILPLSLKDHGLAGQGLDASDSAQNIAIQHYPGLYAFYQPKGLAYHQGYLISANTGAARDYAAYSEVQRVGNVALNPAYFASAPQWRQDSVLGRLAITNTLGNRNNPPSYDSIVAFGGRSFSLWDSTGQLVWDSGDQIEQDLALLEAAGFNALDSIQKRKSSSAQSGSEPYALAQGVIDGQPYLFVGLRQMGGFIIYNMSNPLQPQFDSYVLRRDFSLPPSDTASGDLGTESLLFIPAAESPNGLALLVLTSRVSSSLSLYQMGQGIGLRERRLDGPMMVYPNPSSGRFYHHSGDELEIYNAQGQKCGEVKDGGVIDLSAQADGIYILRDASGRSLRLIKKQ